MTRLSKFLFLIFLLFSTNCFARPEDKLNSIVKECMENVEHWEFLATITLSIMVLIGVLGAVVGILQKLNKNWSAIAVIVTGGAITILTIVQTTAFKTDYRVLRVKAAEGRKMVSDMSLLVEQFIQAQGSDNRNTILEKFQENYHKIYDMNQELYAKSSSFSLFPSAYAQSGPEWLTRPPADERKLFFIGQGVNRNLGAAEQEAFENAVAQAVEFFVAKFHDADNQGAKINQEAVAEFLTQSGQTLDSYFIFDKAIQRYRFHVLFAVDKKVATTDLAMFSLKEGVDVPDSFERAIQQSKRTLDEYRVQVKETYQKIYDSLIKSTKKEVVDMFDKARQLQLSRHYDEAIAMLKDVTLLDNAHYLAWYNLALAYDKLGREEEAMHAFERAVALEPAQAVRDASLYNTFGYFLFKRGRYAEAANMFRHALEINPNHPKAARNLQAAEAKLH